jgi:hypothetical protein
MNAIGTAAMAIGALALSAIAPISQAFAGEANQSQFTDAEVVPTGPEIQQRIQQIAIELRAAKLASASPTQASGEFLAAQRAYEYGMFDEAMADLNRAEREIPATPNWVDPVNVAAR